MSRAFRIRCQENRRTDRSIVCYLATQTPKSCSTAATTGRFASRSSRSPSATVATRRTTRRKRRRSIKLLVTTTFQLATALFAARSTAQSFLDEPGSMKPAKSKTNAIYRRLVLYCIVMIVNDKGSGEMDTRIVMDNQDSDL